MLRIRYVNPVPSGTLDRYFDEQLAGVAGADVEVSTVHLELGNGPSGPFLPRLPFYQGVLFETLHEAQVQGFDAAVIGCSGDPGLLEARRMLHIPVTAPLDSALHLAAQLGQRVAILVADGFAAHVLYQDLARQYGLAHLISEILTVPMSYPDAAELDDPVTENQLVLDRHRAVLGDVALELAAGAVERGADAIYAGCTLWTGDMLVPFRDRLGVPVIDPAQAAVLMAAAAARARVGNVRGVGVAA
jgi:allantoin racemase